jgi:hypothetical protein
MKRLLLLYWLVLSAIQFGVASRALLGARFVPATLSTEDPFTADELSLPTISTIRTPDDGETRETDLSIRMSPKEPSPFIVVRREVHRNS